VRATDSVGAFASRALSINIVPAAIAITTTSLPGGTVGTGYVGATLAATGGTGGFTWTIESGALPAGLTLSGAGAITGTPTAAGLATVTVRATDSVGAFASRALSINIVTGALAITTTSLPGGTVMAVYGASLAATGGTGAYSWTIESGALPLGLTLSTSGVIAGTPYLPGLNTVNFHVVDGAGGVARTTLSINIVTNGFVINTPSLPDIKVGGFAFWFVTAVGGTPGSWPRWSIISGAFPPGLILGRFGSILGQATTAGLYTFTLRATDISGASATRVFSVNVLPVPVSIYPAQLPNGYVGTLYSGGRLVASGGSGTGGYTWSLESGALPIGLTLSSGGVISGTPTVLGLANFTVRATDSRGFSGTSALSINVVAAPVAITTTSLPGGTVGTVYPAATLAATGGTGGFTWAISAGALPAGLTLSAGGTISGTPTVVGLASFTVRATNSGGFATRALSINVVAPAVTVTTTSVPQGRVGTPYSVPLAASGGAPPYTWRVSAHSLPAGLSLSSAGVISGTPTTPLRAATWFTVRATDSAGAFDEQHLSITVTNLTIQTSSLPNGQVGNLSNTLPYGVALQSSGGFGLKQWAIESGTLPPGLTLFPNTGIIAGMPTTAGLFTFTVRVTDAVNATAVRQFSIDVRQAP
jgi:hypothetical protein